METCIYLKAWEPSTVNNIKMKIKPYQMYVFCGVLILSGMFELGGGGFKLTCSCAAGGNFEQNSGKGKAMMHALQMQMY